MLDSLTETDAELAAEVRRLLFVFEDIVKLDDRSIQLVLREADQKDLALALRGVSDEVKSRILQNMSERGAQMLLEEMEYQPPQRKRVIEEAQGRIVAIVRKSRGGGSGRPRPAGRPMPSSEQTKPHDDRNLEFAQLKPHIRGMSSEDILTAAWAETENLREQARAAGEEEGRAAGTRAR